MGGDGATRSAVPEHLNSASATKMTTSPGSHFLDNEVLTLHSTHNKGIDWQVLCLHTHSDAHIVDPFKLEDTCSSRQRVTNILMQRMRWIDCMDWAASLTRGRRVLAHMKIESLPLSRASEACLWRRADAASTQSGSQQWLDACFHE